MPISILGGLLALVYIAGTVLGVVLYLSGWDKNGGLDAGHVLWMLAFVGGFVLLLSGLFLAGRSPRWLTAALISIGAVVGAIPIFWTIIIPSAAIALAGLAILWARRPAARAT